ncbi:MAG: hypothetical protein AAB727_03385 [Patescibacteria group bacterium]
MRWLENEAHGKHLFYWMSGCLVFKLLYAPAAVVAMFFLGITISPVPGFERFPELTPILFISFFGAAGLEEMLFRLPLAIFVWLRFSIANILVIAVGLSAFFGILHGGTTHILVQGVNGFALSLLFLKCGGCQGHEAKALLTTTTVHFLFNMTLLLSGIAIAAA